MQGCFKERNLLNDWYMRRKINDGDFKHEPRGFLFFSCFPLMVTLLDRLSCSVIFSAERYVYTQAPRGISSAN